MRSLVVCAVLFPLAAFAESPFDGTWVMKEDSMQFDQKPYVISLAKGTYENRSAVPPVKVKADGTDQPVKGHAAYDTIAVSPADAQAVEITQKKAGKVIGKGTYTVSSDGNTLTQKWTDSSGTEPVSGETTFTRVGAAPKDANPVSGSWKVVKRSSEANARTMTYKSTGDGMTMTTPNGQNYTAKFDGKPVKMENDPANTEVSLKKVDAHTFVETYHQLGKVTEIDHMTVSPDGKTMKVSWEAPQTHRKGHLVLEKQ